MKQNVISEVLYITEKKAVFSSAYVSVREKEGRFLNDAEVLLLPLMKEGNSNFKEWQLRQKSTQRILHYLKEKNTPLIILDIGCGNGWFTNHLASIEHSLVEGLDINAEELEQANRIFKKSNLNFIYADCFEAPSFFKNKYDIITLNACFQYFKNAKELLTILKSFLKPKGEIHIIDSPFYIPSKIDAAKKRTEDYYKSMGASEMNDYYFHHSINEVSEFEVLFRPSTGVIHKILGRKDSPFMWLRFSS